MDDARLADLALRAIVTRGLAIFADQRANGLGPVARKRLAMKFVIYADGGGNYRWRLVAGNGQTIATSGEAFASKANATRAAENVKAGAGSATIEDE
jgi:uncharacterized protein YegP (UPF0339 family)